MKPKKLSKESYRIGYYQALEDNKELMYTEQDIKKAIFLYTSWLTGGTATYKVGETAEQKIEQIIKSLQYNTEWEVGFIDGKLKIKK